MSSSRPIARRRFLKLAGATLGGAVLACGGRAPGQVRDECGLTPYSVRASLSCSAAPSSAYKNAPVVLSRLCRRGSRNTLFDPQHAAGLARRVRGHPRLGRSSMVVLARESSNKSLLD